ncbi:MAG: ATP adenylyltransferase family protein [Pirellulaceae bacterium]
MTLRRRQAESTRLFAAGTLRERICSTSAAALRTQSLQPIETHADYLEDRGIRFLVRVISHLQHKPPHNVHHNPFLPYEQALYVADATATHACILNKYKVVDLHLLIVTREFEHQESALTLADFQALWRCLGEYESLGFYNSGMCSGASQTHKHLQVVPLPLTQNGEPHATPMEPLFESAGAPPGVIVELCEVAFAHSLVFWDPTHVSDFDCMARQSLSSYHQMLRRHRLGPAASPAAHLAGSYNLLVTSRWMLLVPRRRECYQSISFNSLAFAGALLVQDPRHLDQLRAAGPFAALEWVAGVRRCRSD